MLRRWSSNITPLLCGLSLLIFLLAMGIWVRSYYADEWIYYFSKVRDVASPDPRRTWCAYFGIEWSRGAVGVRRSENFYINEQPLGPQLGYHNAPPTFELYRGPASDDRINVRLAGFQFLREGEFPGRTDLSVVPLWLFLLFAIPPLLWLRRWWRRGGPGRGFPVMVAEAGGGTIGNTPINDVDASPLHPPTLR